MRHFILGTAGHVDHGKTTLVKALTGVDTDRLAEEKRRGITIELGFASLLLHPELCVGFVDVPGHRKLVHTMIAGAHGMGGALLVVAANEGIMPQTLEHLQVLELLGVRKLIFVLTKTDRASDDDLVRVRGQLRELRVDAFDVSTAEVSARSGSGLVQLRHLIQRLADSSRQSAEEDPNADLWVDRVFTVRGTGAVVTGTLVRGTLRVGDRVTALGAIAQTTTIRGLQVHGQIVDAISAPSRVAVNLPLPNAALSRGHRLIAGDPLALSHQFDASWQGQIRAQPSEFPAVLYVGTDRVAARARVLQHADASPIVRVRASRPLPISGGDRFILRGFHESASGQVLGGGVLLDARPFGKLSDARRLRVLDAAARSDPAALVLAAAEENAPRALDLGACYRRWPCSQARVRSAAESLAAEGALLQAAGLVISKSAVVERAIELGRAADTYMEAHPHDDGVPLETLRQKLGLAQLGPLEDEVIRAALAGGELWLDGGILRRQATTGSGSVDDVGQRVRASLDEAGLQGLTVFVVRTGIDRTEKDARAILAQLVRKGLAVHAGDLWFAAGAVERLLAPLRTYFAQRATMTVGDFKGITGTGRRQAIPLLEILDGMGWTRRIGDSRMAGTRLGRG